MLLPLAAVRCGAVQCSTVWSSLIGLFRAHTNTNTITNSTSNNTNTIL